MKLQRKTLDQAITQVGRLYRRNRARKKRARRFTGSGTARVRVQPNGARYVLSSDLVASPKFRQTIQDLEDFQITQNEETSSN